MKPAVRSIDLLVHPWWSGIFDETPYHDYQSQRSFATYLRALRPEADLGDYFSFLGHLWRERIESISGNRGQLFVLQWAHALPDHDGEEQALLSCAQEMMGGRFLLWDHEKGDSDLFLQLWDHIPLRQRLFQGKIAINAYGEKRYDCVPRYGNRLAHFLEINGFSPQVRVVPELCGDVIDGKIEAYRGYLQVQA